MTPRIYLTGSVTIENGRYLIRERDFPGRQARLAFTFLAVHRHRAIGRDELVSALWPDDNVDGGLDPVLSKLRKVFKEAGMASDGASIDASSGLVGLCLPAAAWVDIEAAANALDEAEGAMRRHDRTAWGLANIAVVISRRPFLPNVEAPWIEAQRSVLRSMLRRAMQCLVQISAANNEPLLAIQHAEELIELDPLRETSYQLLMRIHAADGDRAAALRVFAQCRERLREELGVSPSPQTEAVYLEILKAD